MQVIFGYLLSPVRENIHMSTLGELIVPLIYLIIALGAVVCVVWNFQTKKPQKLWTSLGSIFFLILLFSFRSCLKTAYKNEQLRQVGVYYLTSYPNCPNCILELKEDMTYEIRSRNKVIEKSNWHYEVVAIIG